MLDGCVRSRLEAAPTLCPLGVLFIYSVTLFYAFTWVLNRAIESNSRWVDRTLLMLGGYIAGTSLTGTPLMVAVYMRNDRRFKRWIGAGLMVVSVLGLWNLAR